MDDGNRQEVRQRIALPGTPFPTIEGHRPYGRREPVRVREIPSLLLKERIIFVPPVINDEIANMLIGMLLYLDSEDATRDIAMYINCHGSLEGHLYYGLGVYDTMQYLKSDITTVGVGVARGAAAALLAAGTKGKRYMLPNASVILHQPLSAVKGQARDIEIQATELVRQRRSFYEILAKHSGKTYDEVAQTADRVNYLTAEQAVAYGLADEIIKREETQA
ncbi:ATP-dependent Clp protease protease subunit [Thermosporothrix hazakensis]|jgi:ATP-dependent Clp protease protease subunit|uniref:ATP-dependent Clp protease proteolytic subunit n=2 Tax=Thermosporothrix TaxID=768650 RepID=A0A326UFD2_THEHA|nr:ATP-dependent Clp protease proteolytic subunit [Thermosporothrix hazakensis]PZW36615.1 ATP-dependent Clp protease protease subunit [Thermosporothrix hazakensis]BBH89083.1 ATP-dependent Clp protease proteolytic subunit 1 [Thermosporothrix sp. COM3]GCE47266.1 ATP-dependent Clp protease proteolytic subunit 1 [Thermosporothrix hazakensis]